MSLIDRFWAKVSPEPNTGCWLWDGALNNKGYGSASFDGRRAPAHRASFELHVGPIPDGMEIDHLCKVRCCVNPDHLEPVTRLENVRRSDAGYYKRTIENNVHLGKTQCPNGHEYSPENTWTSKNNMRHCRTCHRLRQRLAYRKRAEMKEAANVNL